jgi:subtilisin family serine protease
VRRGGPLLIVATFVAGAACSSFDPPKLGNPAPGIATERQILVMLKESPVRHYRPGSFPQPSYGSGPAPMSQLRTAQQLAREYGFQLVSDWAMPSLGVRCFLGEVPAGQAPREMALRLAADSRVESAQPVQVFRSLGHNDAYYELQTSAKVLKLDELHQIATGKHVSVAQIDTGVDLTHPDLDGQLSEAKNFVDGSPYRAESHGTGVAGIIVAKADNGIGIVGIAPGATLMPLRACWEAEGKSGAALCSSFTLAKALQYALSRPTRVLNLSLGGPQDRLLERLIDKAIDQGIVVVGAVDPTHLEGSFPASHPGVIAVGSAGTAITVNGEVLAPGEHVLTTTPNGSWGFLSGSSFAAAHVSGIAALLLERSPKLKPRQVSLIFRQHVYETADQGSVVDACAALASVSSGSLPCQTSDTNHPTAHRDAHAQSL